jgi:hypothetical protein
VTKEEIRRRAKNVMARLHMASDKDDLCKLETAAYRWLEEKAKAERLAAEAATHAEASFTMAGRLVHAEAEIESLKVRLSDALELAEEGWTQTAEWFQERYDYGHRLRAMQSGERDPAA